jgi:5-methylcytosine-specific restriction endonuclease McrA
MKISVEKAVRLRAQGRREYCHLPEHVSLYRHEIDHIIAVKHRGKSILTNLALACTQCNQFKGPNLAGWPA